MTEYVRTKPRGIAERSHRVLMRLYPPDFRREFADAMTEFFHDQLTTTLNARGRKAAVSVWMRAAMDILRNAIPARFESMKKSVRQSRQRAFDVRQFPSIHQSRRQDWMLSSIMQDVQYAFRRMALQPTFTLIILVTLALGIGANAAIFSVVNGILLHPLPYADANRIMSVNHMDPYQSVSEPEFYDYKRELKSFETIAAIAMGTGNISGGNEEPERIQLIKVSDGYHKVLGVRAQLGRTFLPDEDLPGSPTVVILSDGLWRTRYAADRNILGTKILINNSPRTVVGVMPSGFELLNDGTSRAVVGVMPSRAALRNAQGTAWVPLRLKPDSLWTRNNHYLALIGKLRANVTVKGAQAEMLALDKRFAIDFPDTYAKAIIPAIRPVNDTLLGDTRPYLYMLLGAVAFVLLIACVNVANLFLARGESRRKELAVRTALGASRTRIARQVITESAMYALIGGASGLAVAWAGMRLLVSWAPASVPRLDEVRIDPLVLLFTAAVTVITGILFGIAPALRSTRDDASETLKSAGKTSGQARGLRRARSLLVISEVALAVVTLTAAGLMLRSLNKLQSITLGFRPEHVLTAQVSPPPRDYQSQRAVQFYHELLERVNTIPGVVSAAAVVDLPIGDGNSMWSILIDDAPMTSVSNSPAAMPEQVTPGYFGTMGISIIEGRTFTEQDRDGAPFVVVVNEAMAAKFWPGKSAINGKVRMLSNGVPPATVVGVVKDVRHNGFLAEIPPTMYFPHAQSLKTAYYSATLMSLVVKTSVDPLSLTGAVRAAVHALEPGAPVSRVRTMQQFVDDSVASRRFATQMLVAFALVALLLAGIGIYGVVSYGVTQRTFEIGLRVALGAQRSQVLGQVIGESARLAVAGLAIGVASALTLTRLMTSMFVQITPSDPLTLIAVVTALALVALLAAWLPARRAASVDPLGALRSE